MNSAKPVTVALPLGIGDTHWAVTKFRALSEFHEGRPIHAYINEDWQHRSIGFLQMVPSLEKVFPSGKAPTDIVFQMKPTYMHPRWSTLKGSANWNGFDYLLVPNGHLEKGFPLETWLPELPTEYIYPLNYPPGTKEEAAELFKPGDVILYPSGIGPNRGFHADNWTRHDWARIIQILNNRGVEPVLVGADNNDDTAYRDLLMRLIPDCRVRDLVGKTSIPVVFAGIEIASVWVGFNSGLGIVSAMLGVPTVMLWSDARYPLIGASRALHHKMQRSWLPEERLAKYRTFSFGSPELTAENVVTAAFEVMR